MGAEVLVQFAGGQHEEELFTNRLRALALGAIEFAGLKRTELGLGHGGAKS